LSLASKKFKLVLTTAHENKDNESNTVIIITDMLSEIFSYAKYSEITSEIAIRGTFCDLATQIDKKIQSLIEAKAICHELNKAHVTQAVGYASTQGIEWVVLTNGIKLKKNSLTKVLLFRFSQFKIRRQKFLRQVQRLFQFLLRRIKFHGLNFFLLPLA
jgi:hypothetical protein